MHSAARGYASDRAPEVRFPETPPTSAADRVVHLGLRQDAGRPMLGGRALLRHRSQMVVVAGLPRLAAVRRGAPLHGLPNGGGLARGGGFWMALCAHRVARSFIVCTWHPGECFSEQSFSPGADKPAGDSDLEGDP